MQGFAKSSAFKQYLPNTAWSVYVYWRGNRQYSIWLCFVFMYSTHAINHYLYCFRMAECFRSTDVRYVFRNKFIVIIGDSGRSGPYTIWAVKNRLNTGFLGHLDDLIKSKDTWRTDINGYLFVRPSVPRFVVDFEFFVSGQGLVSEIVKICQVEVTSSKLWEDDIYKSLFFSICDAIEYEFQYLVIQSYLPLLSVICPNFWWKSELRRYLVAF